MHSLLGLVLSSQYYISEIHPFFVGGVDITCSFLLRHIVLLYENTIGNPFSCQWVYELIFAVTKRDTRYILYVSPNTSENLPWAANVISHPYHSPRLWLTRAISQIKKLKLTEQRNCIS